MAIFHCQTKPLSRAGGRSAVAAAAYRAGVELTDERTGVVHDFTRRTGVESSEIVLPSSAPEWAQDRGALWNAAEAAEIRKDARTAREWVVALPAEIGERERRALALEFAGKLSERYGVAVDVAIHAPGRKGDDRNHHAHLLTTTREIGQDGFGEKAHIELSDKARKARGLAPARKEIEAVRAEWAGLANSHLEHAGRSERIDHRSLKAQGIEDREPTRHLGPAATAVERKTQQPSRFRQDQDAHAIAKARDAEQAAEAKAIEAEIVDLAKYRADLERQAERQAQVQERIAAVQAARAEQERKEQERIAAQSAERIAQKQREAAEIMERQAQRESAQRAEQERIAQEQAERRAALERQHAAEREALEAARQPERELERERPGPQGVRAKPAPAVTVRNEFARTDRRAQHEAEVAEIMAKMGSATDQGGARSQTREPERREPAVPAAPKVAERPAVPARPSVKDRKAQEQQAREQGLLKKVTPEQAPEKRTQLVSAYRDLEKKRTDRAAGRIEKARGALDERDQAHGKSAPSKARMLVGGYAKAKAGYEAEGEALARRRRDLDRRAGVVARFQDPQPAHQRAVEAVKRDYPKLGQVADKEIGARKEKRLSEIAAKRDREREQDKGR